MPRKLDRENVAPRVTLSLRTTPQIRNRLEQDAIISGRALALEAEYKIESSYEKEELFQSILGQSLASKMLFTIHQVIMKVRRTAASMPEAERGEQFELSTRRELRAAVEVVVSVYMATETALPPDPDMGDEPRGKWGSGYFGRRAAYSWLEWECDDYLDQAKGTTIRDVWTGDGKTVVADLVKLELLDEEQASRRRFPHGKPSPLVMPRDRIAAEKPARSRKKPA